MEIIKITLTLKSFKLHQHVNSSNNTETEIFQITPTWKYLKLPQHGNTSYYPILPKH